MKVLHCLFNRPTGHPAFTGWPFLCVLARTIYCNSDANPQVVHYTYDDFKRMTSLRYGAESENKRYSFEYDANGQVARVTNHELGRVVLSEHDASNRPMRITHMKGDDHVYTGEVTYDEYNNLERFEEEVGTEKTAYSTAFTYDVENKPTLLKYNDSVTDKVAYTYDELGRTAKRTVTVNGRAYESNYAYIAGEQTYTPEETDDDTPTYATTGLIASISQTGGNFEYTYDDNGNITRVIQDGKSTYYAYDALGQLIRVDDEQENATWVYDYDQGSNILSKKRYVYTEPDVEITDTTSVQDTVAFSYTNANWKDQLKAVNGKPIAYDNIGNPTQYGADNDADKITYEWEKGRQLKKIVKPDETVEFKYNENGLRIKKVATSTGTTNYTLHGKNIVHMTRDKGEEHDTLHFFYDASNKPAIVEYNGTKYAYVHNLQGDIVAILDSDGTAVVQYKYDAWGRQIDCTFETGNDEAEALSTLNPFRYRGYVYDEEMELYYLRTRYYDPENVRFINADEIMEPHPNQYCYCKNTPVGAVDPDGFCLDAFYFDGQATNRSFLFGGTIAESVRHYQGNTSEISSTYRVTVSARAYESTWTNSCYNVGYQSPTLNQVKNTTTLYRSVSEAEANDIMSTGEFRAGNGYEGKQFGFNAEETAKFGTFYSNPATVAVDIPTSALQHFYVSYGIDTIVFRHGVVTVYKEQLPLLNSLVEGNIRIFYK